MKIEHRALLLGLIAAASFWVLDAALSFLFFHEETFLDLLILKVSPHHLFTRLLVIALAVIFAMIATRHAARRRQAEKSRQSLLQQWTATFDAINDTVCVLDSALRVTQCNKAMLKLLGKSRQDVIGHHCYELVHGREKPIEGCPLLRMMETHQREIAVLSLGERWFEGVADPVLGEDGHLLGAVHILSDITERKKAEEEILRSKILLKSSIESPKDMIILSLDREYRYLYFSKTHAESMIHVYGTQPQIGDCILDQMKGKGDIEKVKAHYDRAMAGDGHAAIEEYGEGQLRFYYEIKYNPIYNEKNDIIGITSFAQNITERKQAEDDLFNKEKLLRKVFDTTQASLGISTINDGKFIEVNDAFIKLFGYNKEELMGKTSIELNLFADKSYSNRSQ